MADDDVWNIETCSENWKALLYFKDNCFICANKTVYYLLKVERSAWKRFPPLMTRKSLCLVPDTRCEFAKKKTNKNAITVTTSIFENLKNSCRPRIWRALIIVNVYGPAIAKWLQVVFFWRHKFPPGSVSKFSIQCLLLSMVIYKRYGVTLCKQRFSK